jgi:hypothetical protein
VQFAWKVGLDGTGTLEDMSAALPVIDQALADDVEKLHDHLWRVLPDPPFEVTTVRDVVNYKMSLALRDLCRTYGGLILNQADPESFAVVESPIREHGNGGIEAVRWTLAWGATFMALPDQHRDWAPHVAAWKTTTGSAADSLAQKAFFAGWDYACSEIEPAQSDADLLYAAKRTTNRLGTNMLLARQSIRQAKNYADVVTVDAMLQHLGVEERRFLKDFHTIAAGQSTSERKTTAKELADALIASSPGDGWPNNDERLACLATIEALYVLGRLVDVDPRMRLDKALIPFPPEITGEQEDTWLRAALAASDDLDAAMNDLGEAPQLRDLGDRFDIG